MYLVPLKALWNGSVFLGLGLSHRDKGQDNHVPVRTFRDFHVRFVCPPCLV